MIVSVCVSVCVDLQEDPRFQLVTMWADGANFEKRSTDLWTLKLSLLDGHDKSGVLSRLPFAILERSKDTESGAPHDMQVYMEILCQEFEFAIKTGAN